MKNDIMLSGFVGYRQNRQGGLTYQTETEFGTRRNAVSFSLIKRSNCQNWHFGYHGKIEAVINDDVVSAGPVFAEIRHIVPTVGLEACTIWRGYRISISEDWALPRIRSDDALYPMVRIKIAF